MGRISEEDREPGALDKPWSYDEFKNRRRIRYWRDGQPLYADATTETFIENYESRVVPPDVWDSIAPLTRQAIALAARPAGLEPGGDPYSMATTVVRFVWWAHNEGLDLALEIFHPDTIDRYVAQLPHRPSQGSNTRGILSRVGRAGLGPPLYPAHRVINKRTELTEPYSEAEDRSLNEALRGQTTQYRRDNFAVMVALCRGAGLQSKECLLATGDEVEVDALGVVVHVTTGERPRSVPVLAAWETDLIRAKERVGDRPLFLPNRRRVQRYDATSFIDKLDLPDHIKSLKLQRLRATWIVHHFKIGTPVNLIARAAGMSTDQVGRYSRYLLTPPEHEIRTILRGEAPV